ncbi:MAG: hypothetical protein ACREMK_04045 [Gemmatimonadota bacterium]
MRRTTAMAMAVLVLVGCDRNADRGDQEQGGEEQGSAEARVEEGLGTLRVVNQASEPVAVYLDGREIYSVPPGRAYTFRNLPLGEVNLYGVGRISQRHYGLPVLTIEEGEDYEWTIRQ